VNKRHCSRCGKELSAGRASYTVCIKVFAGFDGVLLEPEGEIDLHLKQAIEETHQWTPEELEKDVYQEITLLLCKSCRDRFIREAQNPWEGPFQTRRDPDGMIH
jgi:hypothetical protein